MTGETCLTPAEIDRAAELKILGMGWKELGRVMKRSPETVRRALDPGFADASRARINARRRRISRNLSLRAHKQVSAYKASHWVDVQTREKVPAEVLADRERRADLPLTINMAILGDPLPGRSALDRR